VPNVIPPNPAHSLTEFSGEQCRGMSDLTSVQISAGSLNAGHRDPGSDAPGYHRSPRPFRASQLTASRLLGSRMVANRAIRDRTRPAHHAVGDGARGAMHPIRIKPLNEVILVADDVSATPHLDTDVLGLEMPAAPDRLNLARVGTQHLGAAEPGLHGATSPGSGGRCHTGDRGDGPGPAAGLHGHRGSCRRLFSGPRRQSDRAVDSPRRPG